MRRSGRVDVLRLPVITEFDSAFLLSLVSNVWKYATVGIVALD